MLLPLTKKVLCTQNRHKSSFVVLVIRHFSGFLLYFATKIYINVLPGCKYFQVYSCEKCTKGVGKK